MIPSPPFCCGYSCYRRDRIENPRATLGLELICCSGDREPRPRWPADGCGHEAVLSRLFAFADCLRRRSAATFEAAGDHMPMTASCLPSATPPPPPRPVGRESRPQNLRVRGRNELRQRLDGGNPTGGGRESLHPGHGQCLLSVGAARANGSTIGVPTRRRRLGVSWASTCSFVRGGGVGPPPSAGRARSQRSTQPSKPVCTHRRPIAGRSVPHDPVLPNHLTPSLFFPHVPSVSKTLILVAVQTKPNCSLFGHSVPPSVR